MWCCHRGAGQSLVVRAAIPRRDDRAARCAEVGLHAPVECWAEQAERSDRIAAVGRADADYIGVVAGRRDRSTALWETVASVAGCENWEDASGAPGRGVTGIPRVAACAGPGVTDDQ